MGSFSSLRSLLLRLLPLFEGCDGTRGVGVGIVSCYEAGLAAAVIGHVADVHRPVVDVFDGDIGSRGGVGLSHAPQHMQLLLGQIYNLVIVTAMITVAIATGGAEAVAIDFIY